MIVRLMQIATCIALGKSDLTELSEITLTLMNSRAGRFGTKGLAITFISSDADQTVMDQIQARFEVAVSELPEKIDSASYSKWSMNVYINRLTNGTFNSDFLKHKARRIRSTFSLLTVCFRMFRIVMFYLTQHANTCFLC
jgi:hypothetical protein